MKTHKDLDVWKESIDLITSIYQKTALFPKHEIYGLTSQIRRSAVSIAANISEGSGRKNSKEFRHFLRISLASMNELETLLIISLNLEYLDLSYYNHSHNKIKLITAQLCGLIKSIEKKIENQQALK